MDNLFSILFYPKGNNNLNKNGKASIYLRITVNGKRCEISINRKVDPMKWNSVSGKLNGNTEEAFQLNKYINSIKVKLYNIQEKFILEDKPYTAIMIKNKFLNKDDERKTLIQIFKEHNDQIEKLVGKSYSFGCYKRYVRTSNHLKNYIKSEYKTEDIFVREVDLKFINGFEYFLKTKDIGNQNTITKYLTNFKKIIRIAYANNWIDKDPFFHWKAKWKAVERDFLSELDINKLHHILDAF